MIVEAIERIRKGPKYRYRRADSGEFCTWLYAKLHPTTTIRETLR